MRNKRKKREKKHEKKQKNKMRFKFGIRSKILLAFLFPMLFLIALGVISYKQTADSLQELYRNSATQIIKGSADYLEVMLLDVETTAYDLSADMDIVNYFSGTPGEGVDYSYISNKIGFALGTDAYVENGYFVSIDAKEHISTNPDIVFDENAWAKFQETEDYIQVTSRNRKVWLAQSEFLDSYRTETEENKGKKHLTLIRRVENILTGQDVGFVILEVRTDVMEELLAGYNLGEGSMAVLIAQDNHEITKQENDAGDSGEGIVTSSKEYINIQQSIEKNGSFPYTRNGGLYWLFYEYTGDLGNCLVTLIPYDAVMEQAYEIRTNTVFLVVIAAIISLLFGTGIAGGIAKSIQRIVDVVEKAAKGDLTASISVKRKDELGMLSCSFNDMISNMRGLIGNVSQSTEQVENAMIRVDAAKENVRDSAKGLNDVVEQIQIGAKNQEDGAQNCLCNMDDLSDKIAGVVENTQMIDGISKETKSVIGDGIRTMSKLNDSSADTVNNLKDIMEEVRELEKKISNISSIIEVITEIADQTNLLSLNASIEAARAGAMGKGFAVVASEVKNLADQSSASAESIRDIIGQVEEQSRKIISKGEETDSVLQSQESAVSDAVKAFHNIDSYVENLNKKLEDIISQTNSISEAKNYTLSAVEGISAIIEESTAATLEMGENISGEIVQVENMSEYTNQLREVAARLKEAVNQFTI